MGLVMGTPLLQHHEGFWVLLCAPGSWSPSDLSVTLMPTKTAPPPCPPDSAHPSCCSLASPPVPNVSYTLKILKSLTPSLTVPTSS